MKTRAQSLLANELLYVVLQHAARHFNDVGLSLVAEPADTASADTFFVCAALREASTRYRSTFRRIKHIAQLSIVRDEFGQHATPCLLLTDYLSRELAENARRLGIEFLDAAGNAYLRLGGNLIWSIGNKRGPADGTLNDALPDDEAHGQLAHTSLLAPHANTGTVAATQILFAMLMEPAGFGRLTQRDFARMAGVGVGTVSAMLAAFAARGWVRLSERTGTMTGRIGALLEPELLLQEFAVNYAARLRDRIILRRFDVGERLPNEQLASIPGMLWGGEVAAEQLLGGFRPASFTLYADPQQPDALRHLVSTYRLRAAAAGSVVVMAKFWQGPTPYDKAGHVPPALIFAELMAQASVRGVERAALVRQYWLTHDCLAK